MEISINIKNRGLTHIIQIDTDIESNLSYNLSEAFAEVIRLTYANHNIVIDELVAKYGLSESLKQSTHENIDYVTWHNSDIVPNAKEPIYVVFEDDGEKPFVINDIIDDIQWGHFVREKKPKQWCYLNEVLKEGVKL